MKDYEVQNKIPRRGGAFFWMQVHGALNMKVESLYIAMFDEVDEATAMFKTAEDSSMSPDQEYWLNLDADGFDLPSDWYLRCAGKAADTLRGSISLDAELGTPKEGIMTIRLEREEDCTQETSSIEFLFPDFDEETTIEISLDGGRTYPYSTPDDIGSYVLKDMDLGEYEVFVRHPGGIAVPMGDIHLVLVYCNPTTYQPSYYPTSI